VIYYPTVIVRYSLFVLKVPLNPKQANKQTNSHGNPRVSGGGHVDRDRTGKMLSRKISGKWASAGTRLKRLWRTGGAGGIVSPNASLTRDEPETRNLIYCSFSVVKVTGLHPVNLDSTPAGIDGIQPKLFHSFVLVEILPISVETSEPLSKGVNNVKFGC